MLLHRADAFVCDIGPMLLGAPRRASDAARRSRMYMRSSVCSRARRVWPLASACGACDYRVCIYVENTQRQE
jgi:hypothetical protein